MPGMPGQTQVASAAAPGKPAPGATSAVPPAHRPDPFKPWWNTTPPPTPVLSEIAPARIAMYGSERPEIQPGIEIHEVPTRRVAGVLSGSGVYALLDGPEGQIVVKPGDPVGDYRVDSITGDAVTLKRVVKLPAGGTQTYTQVIPLTDQGASVSQYSGPAMGAPGMGAGRPPFMGGGFRGRGKMGGAEGIE